MTFWAYMLHCRGGAYYVGHTDDLDYRIGQHQSGLVAGFTADHLPVALVWSQDFPSRHEAKTAEKQINGWSRAKKMALIRGDWDRISMLVKGKDRPSTSSGQTGWGERSAFVTILSPHPARPELVEGSSFSLHPHAQTPAADVHSVNGLIRRSLKGDVFSIEFTVESSEDLVVPNSTPPIRTGELWRTTCFELFAKHPGDLAYTEYNFAPSGAWAAYGFDRYRSGMRDTPVDPPTISAKNSGMRFTLTAALRVPPGPLLLGISAVIEETDGTLSYWALAHPPEGPPDFHHPDCFVLALPAPHGP